MKTARVKYNFILNQPSGKFTVKALMAANPGVSYITLYMRLKKLIADNVIQVAGTEHDGTHRGRSQKVYEPVPVKVKKAKVLQPA
jgi:hypothetical protein